MPDLDVEGEEPSGISFQLTDAPPKNWGKLLADRPFKECLTVSIAAEAFVEAARCLFNLKCEAPVTLSGLRLAVTANATSCQNPIELEVLVVRTDGNHPAAVIYNKYEDETGSLQEFKYNNFDASIVWKATVSRNSAGNSTGEQVFFVLTIEGEDEMQCKHGEAETRIQRLLYTKCLMNPFDANHICVQDSSDSDNVSLELLSHLTMRSDAQEILTLKEGGNITTLRL